MDGSSDARVMLDMDGFEVCSTMEERGELFVLVETSNERVGCPSCGVTATGHGRSVVQVRDLPICGRPMRLVWRRRRFLCREADCPRKTFTEPNGAIEASLTRRAAVQICVRVGTRLGMTVKAWETEIPSFYTTRISTGPVKAQNLVTE